MPGLSKVIVLDPDARASRQVQLGFEREGVPAAVIQVPAVDAGKLELPDDKEILIQYLVQQHGPLPEGEGKAILLNTCTICHDLQRVRTRRATPEGWKELLEEMIFEGAPLSDDNIPVLLTYLARNFRPGQ